MASNPLSTVSDAVFENILEQCIYELVYEAHREDKQASSACQICLKKCRCYVVKPSLDIFGNAPTPATLEKLKCIKCSTLFPTNRYAAHLEKCLGLGGRRAASRSVNKKHLMPNQSSPTLNDSDQEDHHSGVKKKRSVKYDGGWSCCPLNCFRAYSPGFPCSRCFDKQARQSRTQRRVSHSCEQHDQAYFLQQSDSPKYSTQ
ncbi:hypothetical protein BC830DRAFT_1095878 [Chytriomyces sp. MP71]|nr:hypothetical protein BC830DRAFT_1095878 [Chytriomyces sp. MP71]